MRSFLFLFVFLTFVSACNDVEFVEQVRETAAEQARIVSEQDPNFTDNGDYIDNNNNGATIAEITTPSLDPDTIGDMGEAAGDGVTCISADGISGCYDNQRSEVFVGDSFERVDIAPVTSNIFGWRAIINDNGRILSGTSGNNVEFKSYDNSILGEASTGDKSLYFTGRAGAGSIHNLYLVTKSFNLSDTNGIVYFSFDYLPIGLEKGEYLKLEVCNDTLNACGVGSNISVAGLNGSNWKTIFHSDGSEARSNLNGFNHLRSDWINKQVAVRLDGFQRDNFVFRINALMNEGFYENNPRKGVDDAVGIDNFKAFAFINSK